MLIKSDSYLENKEKNNVDVAKKIKMIVLRQTIYD